MNLSGWGLFANVVFGAVGVGYLMYGRRQMRAAYLVCGAILTIFPWFVSNLAALIGVGIVLLIAPFAATWWLGI
ncbi:MAG: amino acid transport protein [Gammaproteobacteria bacterium]